MFEPPRKLEHITKLFQSLCDAVMDLDHQPLVGKVPADLLECAHLIVLADASAVRECANAAEQLSSAPPENILKLISTHHERITSYLFIRSMVLDGDLPDSDSDFDLSIF